MKIIMISGKQGSGKTTLTGLLDEKLHRDYPIVHAKFASVIYEMHDAIRDIQDDYGIPFSEGREVKDGPLLQWLGTEWGRNQFGENVWADALKNYVDKVAEKAPNSLFLIDDCRFENEFNVFPEALRVRLHCSDTSRKGRCEAWRDNSNHPSEIGLDAYAAAGEFDLTLDTEIIDSAGCVALVMAQIDKGSWMEKRNI